MEENKDFERDLASIRNIMERSVKFVSLSGLAGVMAGIYALVASYIMYVVVYQGDITRSREYFEFFPSRVYQIILVGAFTLAATLVTGWYFSNQKAKRNSQTLWNATSKRLLINLGVPLLAGGIFVLITLWHGYFALVAPATLLFYGIALVSASQNLFNEIRYLGYCQIILGLISTVYLGYGLVFWAIGFGVLHIIYGVLMYRKYDA